MLNNVDMTLRRRAHDEPHKRTTEAQMLDALLRIEEMMQAFVAAGAVRVHDEVQINMGIEAQTQMLDDAIEATKPAASKRKNPRQL